MKALAARLGLKILHLPLGTLSPSTIRRIRVLHILSGHDKRKIAPDYVEVIANLADLRIKEGKPNEALLLYRRALEIDPATGAIVWSFEQKGLVSPGFGDVDRLSNGNTLITYGQQKEGARILEVTPDRQVVWELRSSITTDFKLAGRPFPGLYRAHRIEDAGG